MPASDPGVLIESWDGRTGRSENHPNTKPANDFCVCEMRQDFDDRPFVRSRALAQFGPGHSLDQALKFLWRGGLHCQGLLALDVARNALDVFLWRFLHVVSCCCLNLPSRNFTEAGKNCVAASRFYLGTMVFESDKSFIFRAMRPFKFGRWNAFLPDECRRFSECPTPTSVSSPPMSHWHRNVSSSRR